ncbi:tetratricopeptide (TPR) repeat protein [Bradyrhizobium japonicum]
MSKLAFGIINRTISLIGWLFLTSAFAADDLSYFEGAWTPMTGPNIGAPFWFNKAFAGYDAYVPWWGQTSVLASQGEFGSHIKIVGKKDDKNVSCFYYVSKLNRLKMTWNLRNGDTGTCPESLVFEKREYQSAQDATARGLRHAENGEFDTAIAEYNEAIRIDSTYAPAWAARGAARHSKTEYATAIADLSEAIRLNPSSAMYFANRGMSYKLMGDDQAAIANYSDAIRLNLKEWAIYYNRGMAYFAQKKFEEAKRDFTSSLPLKSRNDPDHAEHMLEHIKRELSLVGFKACNRLDEKIWVGVAGYGESDSGELKLRLFYGVEPGNCEDIGRYERERGVWVIVNGENTNRQWRAGSTDTSAKSFCVALDASSFAPAASPNARCSENYALERFYKQNIESNANVHTSWLP